MTVQRTPQSITTEQGSFLVPTLLNKSTEHGILPDIIKGVAPEKGLRPRNLKDTDIGNPVSIIFSTNTEHGYRCVDVLETLGQFVSGKDSLYREEPTPIPIVPFSSVYSTLTVVPKVAPVQGEGKKIILLLHGSELEHYDLDDVFFDAFCQYLAAYTGVYIIITECETVPSSFHPFIQATKAAVIDARPGDNAIPFYNKLLFETAEENGVTLSPDFLANSYVSFMDRIMDLTDFRCDFITKFVLWHVKNGKTVTEETYRQYMASIFFTDEWQEERKLKSIQKTAILSSVASGVLSTEEIVEAVERCMKERGYAVEPFLIRLHLIRLWRTEQYVEFVEKEDTTGWTLTEIGKAYLNSPASDDLLAGNYINVLIEKGGDL